MNNLDRLKELFREWGLTPDDLTDDDYISAIFEQGSALGMAPDEIQRSITDYSKEYVKAQERVKASQTKIQSATRSFGNKRDVDFERRAADEFEREDREAAEAAARAASVEDRQIKLSRIREDSNTCLLYTSPSPRDS